MKKLYNKAILSVLAGLFLFLFGCHNPVYNQTQDNVADVDQRIADARHVSEATLKRSPSLVVRQDLYVDRTPININKQPSWLNSHIIIRGEDLPFSYYSRTIVNGGSFGNESSSQEVTGSRFVHDYKSSKNYTYSYSTRTPGTRQSNVLTRYQNSLDPNVKVSMSYSGTVKGALDLLAAKTGYTYVVNGNNVYWQAFITKTFDIAFMPGTSDYLMGKASNTTSSNTTQGSNSPSGATSITAIIDDSAQSQYSNLKGTLSVWSDLTDTIKQLLSPEGRVIVSQATTTVTVRDRPSNVDLISQYINNFNNNLSKQVLVKIQVLQVTLSNDFNYGINWDSVQRAFGGSNFVLNANFGTPISITTLTGVAVPTAGLSMQTDRDPNGSWFTALINALTQQGKVSVVSEPRVVCLNNQVSAIRVVNQEGYLASIQSTTVPGAAGTSTVTSQITPGTLVTGLTLYILPKIMDGKVYLQVNADLSDKVSISTVSTGTGSNQQSIQVPNVTQKQFNQRSMIASGDTMILSGFRRVSNTANSMQLFGFQSLGGKASSQLNSDLVVLITPIILHGVV